MPALQWLRYGNHTSNRTVALLGEMGRQSTRLVADAIYTAWLLSKTPNASSNAATSATPTATAPVAPVGEWDERVARAAEFDRRADMLKTDEFLADDASGTVPASVGTSYCGDSGVETSQVEAGTMEPVVMKVSGVRCQHWGFRRVAEL